MELFFGHDLDVEQTHRLMLSPEMIQSLNILQFSRGELFDYVYSEMMDNPVIDVDNSDICIQPVMDEYPGFYEETESSETFSDAEKVWDAERWADYADSMNYYDDSYYYGRYSYDAYKGDSYEYSAACDITLEDNLISQMELCDVPYMIKAIGVYIIQTLDDNGYMTCTVEEIAAELNVPRESVQEALEIIWTFDPVGVGAADLCQCLELQLEAIGRLNEPMRLIVRNHLEDVAMNRLPAIARAVGVSVYKVQDCADLLRSLEPKPGRMFAANESTRYIIPDVSVEESNGGLSVALNNASNPKIIIRKEYRNMLREADKNSNVAAFLSGRFNTALWLIRSIEQRNETILKVTEAIVRRQEGFFSEGPGSLKPVTMKEIAEEIGVHESTVSRAVSGKYLQSAQGIFELRYFFSGGSRYVCSGGEQTTSESLKVMIERLVEDEDRTMPLSDRSIAEAIMVTGVEISRRTVAKYREELGIPSSSVRRRVR